MAESLLPFAYLRDARLAGHATSAAPAWLWQPDGQRILWMNAAAADLAGTESPAEATAQPFGPDDAIAGEIARLAQTLPANGSPRLVALDVPAQGDGRRLMCLCSRLTLTDARSAILAVAAEPAGLPLPLRERVCRLIVGLDAPIAAFARDGSLLHAAEAVAGRIGTDATLASLGAGALANAALATGHAEGATPLGTLRIDRIGRNGSVALLATFPPAPHVPAEAAVREPPAAEQPPAPVAVLEKQPAPMPEADDPAPDPDTKAEAQVGIIAEDEPPAEPERPAERRAPLRFVWQMDPDGRFTVASETFAALIGPQAASLLGQRWIDIARALQLDPEDLISRAVDSRETWSGITVSWPADESDERLLVEMSGLPMFDRERTFLGYRGFGVLRGGERLTRAHAKTGTRETPPPAEPDTEAKAPSLSPVERTAFRELARQLSARLKGGDQSEPRPIRADDEQPAEPQSAAAAPPVPEADDAPAAQDSARDLMDRLPVGVLVYRINTPIYANRAFLKWSGDAGLDAFVASGGLDRLFLQSEGTGPRENGGKQLTLTSGTDSGLAECRLFSIMWEGDRAHALAIVPLAATPQNETDDLRRARQRVNQLRSILDVAADGVVIVDEDGTVVRLNRRAETLFGRASNAVEGQPFMTLLAPDSQAAATEDFATLVDDAAHRHPGREVASRDSGKGSLALFMTLGRIARDQTNYCAVFRDISRWKRTEENLTAAKHQAEQASQAKSDFLAKISHEIRTPLNAIIGFSEVMMEERLGPVENERYRAYLKDIHASGEHLVALLTDLLDLSKIEAGKLELKFDSVSLNELTQQCVALMQPQANRARVIIRTSLAPTLPLIVADARSVRQILLNLLSNSIKFTEAGGQVIVSTTLTERNEAVLRVRDTGIGMSEKDIETALEPFRQIETSARGGSGGTGLGLPLTKALVEANRAIFAIKSSVNAGTLVEVAFPITRPPGQ